MIGLGINKAWRETVANAMQAVAKGGGWVWHMFLTGPATLGGRTERVRLGETCAKVLREHCKSPNNRMSMMSLSLRDRNTPASLRDQK